MTMIQVKLPTELEQETNAALVKDLEKSYGEVFQQVPLLGVAATSEVGTPAVKGRKAKLPPVKDDYEPFPAVDHKHSMLNTYVLVQLRAPRAKIGSIHLTDDTQDVQRFNEDYAKVVGLGPLAFCDRETGVRLTGHEHIQTGTFVRIPNYGGKSFYIGNIKFVVLTDKDIVSTVDESVIGDESFRT